MIFRRHGTCLLMLFFCAASLASPLILNNPWPDSESLENIYYSSFSEQPKTLDPARSYSSTEYVFVGQIYEPPLEYDYLKRPYTLIPLTAVGMPEVRYVDAAGQPVTADKAAFSVYTIRIRPGIRYQPHPAFAKNARGNYRYHQITADWLDDHDISTLGDFRFSGTRELVADDYVYQIKRLASPWVNSSIFGLMSDYIVGFRDFGNQLPKGDGEGVWHDLRPYPMQGVRAVDRYTYEITIRGDYPQFLFWLAMPFFAPMPWEAEYFSEQPGMEDKNLVLGWYPVGTGPFMVTENNPNRAIVLAKNPNFREEYFPKTPRGARLPRIDRAVYTMEKEALPRWTKFLQGYYDLSGISADSFASAIDIRPDGTPMVSKSLRKKGIRLMVYDEMAIYYLGFNMLDKVVGGASERARKLRLAISIAIPFEENIAIFYNGRARVAQGPLPPGIFGFPEGEQGINPYVYTWENGTAKRRPLEAARQLMVEAGYPGGMDPATGKPLILHYDVPLSGSPDDKAQLDWMRKQFARIGIDLDIRGTLYNRFQDKMRAGNAQIFSWGWYADYPDPENFLFMLYGANGKVKHGGENAANYDNPIYNRLFDAMKNRPNDAERLSLIRDMLEIVQHDAPWIWGVNTSAFTLAPSWVAPWKPNPIAQNTLKYLAVDPVLRNRYREAWNVPRFGPLAAMLAGVGCLLIPLWIAYRRHEREPACRSAD